MHDDKCMSITAYSATDGKSVHIDQVMNIHDGEETIWTHCIVDY